MWWPKSRVAGLRCIPARVGSEDTSYGVGSTKRSRGAIDRCKTRLDGDAEGLGAGVSVARVGASVVWPWCKGIGTCGAGRRGKCGVVHELARENGSVMDSPGRGEICLSPSELEGSGASWP